MAIGTKIAIAKQCNKKAHYMTASLSDGNPGCCHNPKTCKSLSGKWWDATGGVGAGGDLEAVHESWGRRVVWCGVNVGKLRAQVHVSVERPREGS